MLASGLVTRYEVKPEERVPSATEEQKDSLQHIFLKRSLWFAPRVLLVRSEGRVCPQYEQRYFIIWYLCGESRTIRRRVTGGNFFKARGKKKKKKHSEIGGAANELTPRLQLCGARPDHTHT